MSLRRVLLFLVVFVLANVSFIALHYYADLRPTELVKQRVVHSIKTGDISETKYPLRFGYPSLLATIGLDHNTDCQIDLMALYRDKDPLKNAIVPGFYKGGGLDFCQLRSKLSLGEVDAAKLRVMTKPRLWHGAKAVLLLSLPRLDYHQIHNLIKLSTYFLYGFIAVMIALLARHMVWPYLPIMMTGIFASGVVVQGGISYAIPHLWVLAGVTSLLLVAAAGKRHWMPLLSLVFGCGMGFVFVTSGALMLALPLLAFACYFVIYQDHAALAKLKYTVVILVLFMVGCVGSLLFKQLASLLYDPNAWRGFVDMVAFRINGEVYDEPATPARAIALQLKWYHLATLGWEGLANFLKWGSVVAWVLALLLGGYHALRDRNLAPLVDLSVFAIAPLVVFARFSIMDNHSIIHVSYVGRYLFVALCFGFAALVYFLLRLREKSQALR